MAHNVIEINCPGCGAPVSINQTECEWCHGPVTISTMNSLSDMDMPKLGKYRRGYSAAVEENPDSPELNTSLAFCYFKLKFYDKALAAFEKAIEEDFDNSETYFYAAICMLGGKKPFNLQRPVIKKIEDYINAALMLEAKGIYYYFLAYIKKDYYGRKYLKTSPTMQETLSLAEQCGVSEYDKQQFCSILGIKDPF